MYREDGPIVIKSVDFAVKIVSYCNNLNSKKQFVFSNQLLKSGTSIGANVFEAQYAESKLDFIHKMKIALKEANETLYWLTLCKNMEDMDVNDTLKDLSEIMAILSKIIITSKKASTNQFSLSHSHTLTLSHSHTKMRSISFSSVSVNERFSRQAMESVTCSGLLTPMSTEVTAL